MKVNKLKRSDFSRPIAVIALLVLTFLFFVMTTLVSAFDAAAQSREEDIVSHGLNARVQEVASTVLPQAMWDDAVRNLDTSFNHDWANDNLGAYLTKTGGFDEIFVLDSADQPIYSAKDGKPADRDAYRHFAPTMTSFVANVRAAERKRGPLPLTPPVHGVLASPIQASGIVAIGDEIYIVVATLVTPDFGRARPRGPRAPIVVTAMLFDQSVLDVFANRFRLDGVHLHPGNTRFEKDEAHAPLRDAQGKYIATLDWLPQKPAKALLTKLGPGVLSVGGLLLAAIAIFYGRSRKMARGLIASEARATHLAFHDTLTGLPNRRLLLDRVDHALAKMSRTPGTVAIHCLDLDHFKDINDTLGHLVGDELIREAASRMAAQCRATDTFARLSGDEFAITQTDANAAEAAALAARLCEVMQQPFELSAGRIFSSCSIGVALIEDGSIEAAELFRRADLALYRAKAEARGHFCFFEQEMDTAVKLRRSLEADLRDALAANELALWYQPQVDGQGMINGVEALVRWRHPVRGDVSPGQFVPIAEQSGLIATLGMFTLRQAFLDSRRWPGLRIGINVSANQIRMKQFLPDVRRLVKETKVRPARFELEITEGILLRDDPDTHETLRALRSMGFSLVLDDFGTGYSSLSYLRNYPISKIKIDRSFIATLGLESEGEEVVGAIVRLARALHLGVIAEGVETVEQRDWLSAVGCPDVQGYLFGKAMPFDAIDILWASQHRGRRARPAHKKTRAPANARETAHSIG